MSMQVERATLCARLDLQEVAPLCSVDCIKEHECCTYTSFPGSFDPVPDIPIHNPARTGDISQQQEQLQLYSRVQQRSCYHARRKIYLVNLTTAANFQETHDCASLDTHPSILYHFNNYLYNTMYYRTQKSQPIMNDI